MSPAFQPRFQPRGRPAPAPGWTTPPAVLDQHAEGASFVWILRDAAVRAPHLSLQDLTILDQRIDGYLDGLRCAGDDAWELCRQALESGDPGDTFAAAVLAFGGQDAGRVEEVVAAGVSSAEAARGVVSALGWLPYSRVAPLIKAMFAAEDRARRRLGIAAATVHRQVPGNGMEAALADPDPAIRARTCRTAGELGSVGLHQTVRKSLKVDSEACRFWAAWTTALIVGDSDGLASLRAFAESPDDSYAARALQVAMRRMEPVLAKAWQREMVRNPGLHRRSIIAAGIIGDPEVVPWLTEQMKVPALSRVAGEAFSMITGAHLDHDKLEGQQPEGFESGPTEDPEDENVAMDLDENLAWPDPDLVAKWWDKNKGRFAVGTRYLAGRTMTIELLQQVLREGYQRQRAAAALELAIRQPGQPLFEVRAPGFRQQKLLGLK